MGGLAEIMANWPVLIAQIVNFTILLVLLRVFAYKRVLKMLDERSRRVKESMDQAESTRKQTEKTEAEIKKQLEAAGREGQERISRAMQAGEELKQKAKEDARHEAETIVVRARGDIQRERDEAINELRQEFADLTIRAAEKVIDRSLDKKAHRDLIDKVLEESASLKKEKS
ncbi:MAG: F0F1 ATP synthase subunit B [Chloroflexota bacterium]